MRGNALRKFIGGMHLAEEIYFTNSQGEKCTRKKANSILLRSRDYGLVVELIYNLLVVYIPGVPVKSLRI